MQALSFLRETRQVSQGKALQAQSVISSRITVQPAPLLSVIVPTFKERDNVAELVRRLHLALVGVAWEVIFVDDDSPDGTADAVRALALTDARVRCVQRIGRRGLSSACVEGMLASSAPYLCVMDGDLQHDETILPDMLGRLTGQDLDIVVGSRYVAGGAIGDWTARRAWISRLATRISHLVVPPALHDPMSGFFMLTRPAFTASVRSLSSTGFKILVDLFASSPTPLRFAEVPYTFRNRNAGESKLDNRVAWDYGMLLADKLVGHLIPVRFLSFALIGGVGVGVHFLCLSLLMALGRTDFATAHTMATGLAMLFNFTLNNLLTYRDRRLSGLGWFVGLFWFVLACSIGALANVGIAIYLFKLDGGWPLAALAGIAVGSVWNYVATSALTWKKRSA